MRAVQLATRLVIRPASRAVLPPTLTCTRSAYVRLTCTRVTLAHVSPAHGSKCVLVTLRAVYSR